MTPMEKQVQAEKKAELSPQEVVRLTRDRIHHLVQKYLSLPILEIEPGYLDTLGEYSCSMPTGQIPGKRWKCDWLAFRPDLGHPPGHLWVVKGYGKVYTDPEQLDRNGKPREFIETPTWRPVVRPPLRNALDAGLKRLRGE